MSLFIRMKLVHPKKAMRLLSEEGMKPSWSLVATLTCANSTNSTLDDEVSERQIPSPWEDIYAVDIVDLDTGSSLQNWLQSVFALMRSYK